MGSLLKNIIAGARQVLVFWPDDDYVRPARDGFKQDAIALGNDSRKVAADLRKTLNKHGKQIDHR